MNPARLGLHKPLKQQPPVHKTRTARVQNRALDIMGQITEGDDDSWFRIGTYRNLNSAGAVGSQYRKMAAKNGLAIILLSTKWKNGQGALYARKQTRAESLNGVTTGREALRLERQAA